MSLSGPISPRAAEPNRMIRRGWATSITRRTRSSMMFGSVCMRGLQGKELLDNYIVSYPCPYAQGRSKPYLLPGINAYQRSHKDRTAILTLNFFLGWTFIGWGVALVPRFKG